MKAFKILSGAAIALFMGAMATACTEDSPITERPEGSEPVELPAYTTDAFAKGADISWVTELENKGYKFYTPGDHQATELTELLRKSCGVNAIRLRVWVNPPEGWCNISDMVIKARRAKKLGMGVMVDFHFSDVWADPGTQSIPEAWKDYDLDQMLTAIKAHVTEALEALARQGIAPEWVQIGNETRTGMLWPLGSIDTGDNFTKMVNAGYDAVKAVCPEAQVIVHCDQGNNRYLYDRLFPKLEREGAKYDMIAMSLYPELSTWEKDVKDCLDNIDYVLATFKKPVIISEIGIDYREEDIADSMMRRLMDGCIERGVKGIFWWEPETPTDNGYKKGCFNENGEPTKALDCFK